MQKRLTRLFLERDNLILKISFEPPEITNMLMWEITNKQKDNKINNRQKKQN